MPKTSWPRRFGGKRRPARCRARRAVAHLLRSAGSRTQLEAKGVRARRAPRTRRRQPALLREPHGRPVHRGHRAPDESTGLEAKEDHGIADLEQMRGRVRTAYVVSGLQVLKEFWL